MATKITHVLSTPEILKKLLKLGYFGTQKWADIKDIKGERLQRAVTEFQKFHGLAPDGEVGPRTAATMNRHRCGLPDYEMRLNAEEICKWPMKQITYAADIRLPGITDAEALRAYDVAAAQWMAICGIAMERTPANQANIYAKSGVGKKNGLDNKGGTLAWSELPCSVTKNTQLDQMYDEAEAWSFNMAVAVICHEMGHALGLPHLAKGNLMAPYYDPNTTKPQKGDIAEMVTRYGKVANTPTVPTLPPGEPPVVLPDVSGVIKINGQPYVLVPRA